MNHMAKKNYMEIICKFFPDFQTLIRFFSTVFKQNQKPRIFRTVIFYELETCQVSAKLKNLFFSSVHPSTHPSQRILWTKISSILESVFEIKKKIFRPGIRQKESQIGTPIGTTKGGPALGDKRLVTSSKLRVNLATFIFFTNMVHHRIFCIHRKYMHFTIKFSFYQRYLNAKSRVFHNDKNLHESRLY